MNVYYRRVLRAASNIRDMKFGQRVATVAVALLLLAPCGGAFQAGWPSLSLLSNATALEWSAFAEPLAIFAKYTYTSTAGSTYYRPKDANATIAGEF